MFFDRYAIVRFVCSSVSIMSDEALTRSDSKIASLEEAILKCEVQLQKAKRQCDALPASALAVHSDKHPQVIALCAVTSKAHTSMQIQMFELQRLGREKELLLEEKRQLRDERLLLLMSRLTAPVGSDSISRMISDKAQHNHGSNGTSMPKKHARADGNRPLVLGCPGMFAWQYVTPLSSRRMGPAATAARVGSDTHIIITGGFNHASDACVCSCEALLPDGQASPLRIGNMQVARAWHCAVACDGHIYVMGGSDNAQRYLCSVERCNLQDGNWLPCSPMSHTRYGFAAVALNGFIYCIGGYDGNTWVDSVERYSPRR